MLRWLPSPAAPIASLNERPKGDHSGFRFSFALIIIPHKHVTHDVNPRSLPHPLTRSSDLLNAPVVAVPGNTESKFDKKVPFRLRVVHSSSPRSSPRSTHVCSLPHPPYRPAAPVQLALPQLPPGPRTSPSRPNTQLWHHTGTT